MSSTAYEEPGKTRVYQDNYGHWRFTAVTRDGRVVDSTGGFPTKETCMEAVGHAGLGAKDGFVVWGDGTTSGAGTAQIPVPKIDPVKEALAAGLVVDRDQLQEVKGTSVREGDPVAQGVGPGLSADEMRSSGDEP